MDREKENLLYRPELAPEKHYKSDADFKHSNTVPNLPIDNEQPVDNSPSQIRADLEEIDSLIKKLPKDIHFWKKSIEKIKTRTKVEWPNGTTPIPPKKKYIPPVKKYRKSAPHIGHLPQEQNPKLINMPSLFPSTLPIQLELETPKTLVQIIKDGYNKDQIQLEQNYLQQLQLIMQRYFQQMITTMSDCGLSDISQLTEDFDGNYVKIPPGQGLEHLRDEIVRSQIMRNQKARMFKKTHKVDNTLQHLRSWHAAEQQRERYYGEKYKDSGSYVESHSNAILRKVRRDYDKGYSATLYDMYRYLNSSALLTNDILEMTVREAQAKAMLLKAGVNIFEKEPVTLSAELGGIAGNSGQAVDGSGSGFDTASSKDASSEANTNSSNTSTDSSPSQTDTTKVLNPSSSNNNNKGIFNSLPDIVQKGSGGGIGGWIKKSGGLFDSLPDIARKGVGGGIGGAMKQSSAPKSDGISNKIGEYIYKSSGNNLLGAIAGAYVQNRINKGIKIGKVKINGDGVSYGKLSYDGKNIKYGNISYDGGKITGEKVINMLKEGGYINEDVSEIVKAGNQEQALNLIQEKLQKYVAEKARLEESFKNGDETSKDLISQLTENCRQLLLTRKRILNGKD
nr:MAG TPA: hypothetical protein [Caudoviricetes sp.]